MTAQNGTNTATDAVQTSMSTNALAIRDELLRVPHRDRPHHAYPGATDEHYTPPEVFEALGCEFDLDPCQPEQGRAFLSVPCRTFLTASDDGLTASWHGFVWLNPPFGGRNGVVPWLTRFIEHGNGIALVNALTSAGWFHEFAPKMDALLFPRGKTKFVRADGTRGMSPANGVVLMALGERGVSALRHAANEEFGMLVVRDRHAPGTNARARAQQNRAEAGAGVAMGVTAGRGHRGAVRASVRVCHVSPDPQNGGVAR